MATQPIEVTEEERRVIRARLGLEAEGFARSHFGQYISRRVDQDLERFTQELVNTDPHKIELCMEIRNNILVRNLFSLWMKEAIGSGLNAERELKEEDMTEI